MDKKQIIEDCLKQCMTAKEIGQKLGNISRQRVYQLMSQYNLSTSERKKKGYWKDQSPELKWLNRTLTSKQISAKEKDDIINTLEGNLPTVCPVLGIELVYGNEGTRKDNSASIDRYDSSKPYSPENVSIISWRANRIKNDGTLEEHMKLVEWLQKNLRD